MIVAYHTFGKSASEYTLRKWVEAGKMDINAAPGIAIEVGCPKQPYAFSRVVASSDKVTLGGAMYSRVYNTPRRIEMGFPPCRKDIADGFIELYNWTYGLRVPFLMQEPTTSEIIAVTAQLSGPIVRQISRDWYQPENLELVEW